MITFSCNSKNEIDPKKVKHLSTVPLFLAPMAGLTHVAFRQLIAELGGCSIFYTEMLNSRIVANQSIKDDIFLKKGAIDRPLVAQLVGNDAATMVKAAVILQKEGFDGIDINMGCSRKAITKHGWGAAMLNDPDHALEIVRSVRDAVCGFLSVKLRSIEDHNEQKLIDFCKRLEENGVDLVVVHPRTPKDGFKRPARWEEIKRVVQELAIPVVGNGDIVTVEDILRMHEETGCSGVMIGRAAVIRPWIFWEMVYGMKWRGNILDILEKAAFLFEFYLPESMRTGRFIDFCNWILRNYAFYHYMIKRLCTLKSIAECLDFLKQEIGSESYSLVERPFGGRL